LRRKCQRGVGLVASTPPGYALEAPLEQDFQSRSLHSIAVNSKKSIFGGPKNTDKRFSNLNPLMNLAQLEVVVVSFIPKLATPPFNM